MIPTVTWVPAMAAETTRRAGDVLKLRMKIGAHEFEADGAREVVLAQLESWKHLAGLITDAQSSLAAAGSADANDPAVHQLFSVSADRTSITLRATLRGRRRNANAALLLLYGCDTLSTGKAEIPRPSLPSPCAPRVTRTNASTGPLHRM